MPSSADKLPCIRPDNETLRTTSRVDEADAQERYEVDSEDSKASLPDSAQQKKVISWEDGDPENPYNWSSSKKVFVVLIGMIIVINSTIGSALPSNAIPFISHEFHIVSPAAQVLPISMYLVGYIVGPLLFAPLSESYGRKRVMLWTFALFTIFTMACALSPNFGALLAFRLLAGINASSPIAVTGGMYADIYNTPVARGRAVASFIGGTCIGPLAAPVISGFASTELGWRWSFWIALIIAGPSLGLLVLLPETFGPILLARRAQALRKSTGNSQIIAPIELEKKGFKQMATVTLTRPLRMLFFEPIVAATCIFLGLAYGFFYMYFISAKIIFQELYKLSPGVAGLMFLPIAAGAAIATALFLYYDSYLRRAQALNKPWTRREESRRLPLACIGAPFYVVGLFWLAWASREGVPFWVPMLAGIPFGLGFVLVFMALLNYLTDAYEVFAASAMAASSFCRSIAGAVLPLATTPMYRNLGVPWATSLLAFLSLGMCAIPFVFLWKGDVLRRKSPFCIELRARKEQAAEALALEKSRKGLAVRDADADAEKV